MLAPITVGAIGDSVTAVSYFSAVPDSRWVAIVEDALQTIAAASTFTNYGADGRVTTDYLTGGSNPPSSWTGENYYILSFGFNEVGSTAQFRTDTEALIAAVEAEGGTPILMTQYGVLYPTLSTVDRNPTIEGYNDEYRDIAAETGVGLIDLFNDTIAFVNAAGDMRIRNWAAFGGTITDPNYWGPSTLDEDGLGGPTISALWRNDIHPNVTGNVKIAASVARYLTWEIMAAITWTDVTNHAPDIGTVAAGAQTDILAYVNDEAIDPDALGGSSAYEYKLARIYLAAHFGTIATVAGSAGGAVKREKVGDLEIEFAVGTGSMSASSLTATRWGKLYLELVQRAPSARGPWVF